MDGGKRSYTAIMHRFGRWIFNGLAAVSLVLCVATVVIWVRSYWTFQILERVGEQWTCFGESDSGALFIEVYAHSPERHRLPYPYWMYVSKTLRGSPSFAPNSWHRFGFYFEASGAGGWTVAVPHWLFCIIFLALPALWLRRHRRERRQIADGCRSCGYNLTGNVSGVCPECGKPIGNAVKAK
jgi:4-amino-4-deoxy-L-arabinose transferase-like glycosyltransferase